MKIVIKIILVFFLSSIILFAQDIHEQKYKLAESYEKKGDYEESLRLYLEIYKAQKSNEKFFSGVIRSLKGLDRYSDMLPYIDERLEKHPNAAIYILSGEILWKLGETKNANNKWDDALKKYSAPEVFLQLTQVQINLRLYDKAINTLKTGRKEFKQDMIFSDELSKLYIATGNYREGLDEILMMLTKDGDMAKSQGRLFAFLTSDEAIEYIDNRLDKYASEQSDNIYIQELYSWFLRNTNKLDKALEITIRIDDLRKSEGRTIVYFGNNARDDGQYDIALKAYSHIIKQGNKSQYTPSALYGFTRTLELKMLANEEFSKNSIGEISKSYHRVIKDYPGSQYSAQAYLRLASLNYEYLNNIDEAIKYIEELQKNYRNQNIIFEALNILGEIYVGRNEFVKAKEAFKQVAVRSGNNIEKDNARYNLANIEFYLANIDSALILYNEIASNSKSDFANNALEKMLMINSNIELVKGLKLIADAEVALFANENEKAIDYLKQIIKEYPNDDLAERAYVKISRIHYSENGYRDAIEVLTEYYNKYPNTINKDLAYYYIGKSYLKLDNNDKAQNYFTKILVEYPRSIYLQEARQLIRQLRKEA